MNKYKINNLLLTTVKYNFAISDPKTITVSIGDTVEIAETQEKQATILVSREVNLGPQTNSYIKVGYEVLVDSTETIDSKELLTTFKSKGTVLSFVFSKISVIISSITNMCPIGAIITPPNYKSKEK
ncbi:MAG: hypothetical protein IJD83_01455 [Clostridia bacterium]|nr:hypothetical protein [Clostridia bacterium]